MSARQATIRTVVVSCFSMRGWATRRRELNNLFEAADRLLAAMNDVCVK